MFDWMWSEPNEQNWSYGIEEPEAEDCLWNDPDIAYEAARDERDMRRWQD